MKQQWLALAKRFDALARRERAMVAAAVLLAVPFLGYSLLIEPQLLRQASLAKRIAQARTDRAGIEAQLAGMHAQLTDPDAGNRAALQQTRASLSALDAKLRSMSGSLVPPDKMQALLESLLGKHRNLELLSLRTLPPEPLVEPAKAGDTKVADNKAGKKRSEPGPVAASEPPGPDIYKHGVEIRIAGSYNDLLAYLAALERLPQRILWNRVTLVVDKYPRNVLTLTVYTLSLDKQWLVV